MNRLIEAQTHVHKHRGDYVAAAARTAFADNTTLFPPAGKPFDNPYVVIPGVTADEAEAFARYCYGQRIEFRSVAGTIQTVDVKGIRAPL